VSVLGLDTATPATTVAVLGRDGRATEARDDPPPDARGRHGGRLLALIERAIAESGGGWEAVERIAVGVGPGSFTGLRIGIATARGLAQARGLPLAGVGSLHALAAGAAAVADGRPVAAIVDARRGEVFAAVFDAAGQPLLGPAALGPEELAERLRRVAPTALAVGDGAVRFEAELAASGAVVPAAEAPVHRLSAVHVCRLGAVTEPAERDALLPDYRREPDARLPYP
jgi:tRNA threonylcarbamoyladenosine biosynthesis protein TsaB